ncbi:MAG TPA: hypothetical protein HA254_02570 [Candidatus Diapherotrites archaeon]|uniref:Class I SAM-dependent methyltransferase n=1 Tax=Candidatus Iainarchaeum sp. TaxID=3101447 RepID=A0A7J4IVP5_9ARCH|nr:hypothetical protein [Candidatus Diapherotrites archaeon]
MPAAKPFYEYNARARKQLRAGAIPARVYRPEELRDPRRASRENLLVKIAKEKDEAGSWHTFRIPLKVHQRWIGGSIDIQSQVARAVDAARKRGLKAFVLELGCGLGDVLAGEKAKYGDDLVTYGSVLKRTRGADYAGVDHLLEGELRNCLPRRQIFDFVFSLTDGSFSHTRLKAGSLERVIGLLRPGGTAALHMGREFFSGDFESLREVKAVLAENGIKHYATENDVLVFTKPYPHLP